MRHNVFLSAAISAILLGGVLTTNLLSHCQIPCGIYDDDARFGQMLEDTVTLDKSVKQIQELSKATPPNYNQLVRWVNNKELHADKIGETVFYYFLAQRIKPDQEHYQELLVAAHKIIVLSMEVKQTVDLEKVEELKKAIVSFQELYSHKH